MNDFADFEMDPQEIEVEFQKIYDTDEKLRDLLGPGEGYSLQEKESIFRAYKEGGGIAGLAGIIADDEEEGYDETGGNEYLQKPHGHLDDDMEETEINLEDPEDVKIIEEEFKKLYASDDNFRQCFGEEAFELPPLQKYQIIDAYNQNGMEGVIELLSNGGDNSMHQQQMSPQNHPDMMEGDDGCIYHDGKKYNRI